MRHRRVNPISQASSCMVVAFVMWSTVGPYVGPHQRFSDASQTLLAISGYPDSVTRGGGANSVEAAWHRVMARVFFFVVAPFSCPASLVSRVFFAVGPGCAKCFFFCCAPWAPRPFGGARAKKNTTQSVFFCSGPGERQGKEKPRAGTGPEQK